MKRPYMILPDSDHHLIIISENKHRIKTCKSFAMYRVSLLLAMSITFAFACILRYTPENIRKGASPSQMDKETIFLQFFSSVLYGIAFVTMILYTVYSMFQFCKSGKEYPDDSHSERKGKAMAKQEGPKDWKIFLGSTCCGCQHCNDVNNVFHCERKKEAMPKQEGTNDATIFLGSNYCECQHCMDVFNKLRSGPSEMGSMDYLKCPNNVDDIK